MLSNDVRPAAVAGMFYPGQPGELTAQVDSLLSSALPVSTTCPKVLIVPHAGYIYSGQVAASAYGLLDSSLLAQTLKLPWPEWQSGVDQVMKQLADIHLK